MKKTPRLMHRLISAVFVVLWLNGALLAVENWPEYRGPHGDGRAASDAELPLRVDASKVRWKTTIHGRGWSSPVVWGNQIWLTTATPEGKKMYVICVDRRDGSVRHDLLVWENEDPDFCHPLNSYATPTPVVEEGRVYAHFGKYGTICVDTQTGETVWQRRDLPCNHFRGPASSPILHAGKLIVAFDGFDLQYVVALDKRTGETVWRQKREIDYGTDDGDLKKAYCTAQVITVDGVVQLISPSAAATLAYAPATGEMLWRVYHEGMNASARPLYGAGLVFLTNGMGKMVAVRPDGRGDVTDTHVAWSSRKSVAKKTSQLYDNGLLYMVSDNGVITCLEATTGEVIWQHRAGGEFAASPILAGGRMYFFDAEGRILALKLGRKFELLSESQLGDGYMASPAVVGNELILRSKSHLYSVVERPDPP
jgi:outer membrane protein assembly factor BamB